MQKIISFFTSKTFKRFFWITAGSFFVLVSDELQILIASKESESLEAILIELQLAVAIGIVSGITKTINNKMQGKQ